nr:MAG TPA: hypothetical protein [Caudoviricetes sp.]
MIIILILVVIKAGVVTRLFLSIHVVEIACRHCEEHRRA